MRGARRWCRRFEFGQSANLKRGIGSRVGGRTGAGHPGQQNGTLHGPADGVQYVCVLDFKDLVFFLFSRFSSGTSTKVQSWGLVFFLIVCFFWWVFFFRMQGAGAGEPEAAAVRRAGAAEDASGQQGGLVPDTCARGGGETGSGASLAARVHGSCSSLLPLHLFQHQKQYFAMSLQKTND